MLPTLGFRIVAPTGRQHMQVMSEVGLTLGMILTVASMGVNHRDIATLEGFASDLTIEVIQALPATRHQLTQQPLSILVERRAEHGRHGQDDMAVDHPLVESLADLTHPIVHVNFGTPQAQRRLTTHRHQMLALSTLLAAVFDIAHVVGVAAVMHLFHEAVIVRRVIARAELFKPLPVIGKELFEDTPVPGGLCHHRVTLSWSDEIVWVKRFYHDCPASSTPRRLSPKPLHPTHLSLSHGGFWNRKMHFPIRSS